MTTYNPFSLEGKKILVTGASSGIGRSIAVECSKMGASVVATGRNEERLKETLAMLDSTSNSYIVADLNSDDELNLLINQLPELDGAVLCAGIGMTLPISFSSRDKFMKMFQTNFFSPIELCRLLLRKKRISKGGSVIFISSVAGDYLIHNGNAIYGSTKSALNSMMKYFVREFSNRKIRFNSICPGMVETPLIHEEINITDEQFEKDRETYPLKRYGKPEDIAYGAVYLLSDATSWITGHSLVIDGGVTV